MSLVEVYSEAAASQVRDLLALGTPKVSIHGFNLDSATETLVEDADHFQVKCPSSSIFGSAKSISPRLVLLKCYHPWV